MMRATYDANEGRELSVEEKMANRTIGTRVKAVRQERGMTMIDLARRVGISQAQISRLEHGLCGFCSGTLIKIAKALGKPPFYFMMNGQAVGNI